MTPIKPQSSEYNMNAFFEIENPQIVNGCQTVNSIYEYLENIPPQDLEREFKDTFVMLKILVIDRNDDEENQLYKDIVKYNNSQNAIDKKTFVAGGYIAYVKKNLMLKFDSEPYNTAVDFIKNDVITIDTLLDLYMLYRKAEQTKKKRKIPELLSRIT